MSINLDDLQEQELIGDEGSYDQEGNVDNGLNNVLDLSLPDDTSQEEEEDDDMDPYYVNQISEPDGDDDDDYEQGFDNPKNKEEEEEDEESSDEQHESIIQSDAINELLRLKGINDPSLVKFEDDDGNLVEEDFYNLPYNEQIEILKSTDNDIDYDLGDDEIDTINFLRRNEVKLEDVIEYYKTQAVEEYINSTNVVNFDIDNYNDEELYVLDMKAKFEDLDEDELALELDKALQHPDLFKKKIDKIRNEYKEAEDTERESIENNRLNEENDKFETLKNDLIDVAQNIEDIGGVTLEIDDKNDILEYILVKDVNGKTNLDKLIADPNEVFELAWYATKGKEAFDFIHSYYKKEIENVRKTAYNKAKDEAKVEAGKIKTPVRVSAIKKTDTTYSKNNVRSVDDLYD